MLYHSLELPAGTFHATFESPSRIKQPKNGLFSSIDFIRMISIVYAIRVQPISGGMKFKKPASHS